MKKIILFFSFLCCAYSFNAQTIAPAANYKTNWTVNPFDHQLFIENLGQFDNDLPEENDKIFFQAHIGNIKAYFTSRGVIYYYEELPKAEHRSDESERKREEKEEHSKPIKHYFSALWDGADPAVTVDTYEQQSYPYKYATSTDNIISARIFRKIIYHNIYPGIDVEYEFKDSKAGLKYNVIVHPGADISLAKLKYTGAKGMRLDENENLVIHSDMGDFTDHSPVSYYSSDNKKVNITYQIKNAKETFVAEKSYDKNKELIIDPWTTNPNFIGNDDYAYDVNYDNKGNVYAYGSLKPFQLVKLNSAGVIQWLFNASGITDGFETFNANNIYGDFAVDRVTGTSYLTDGCNNSGPMVVKVNTAGNLVGSYYGHGPGPFYNATPITELWRAQYNPCTHSIVTAGGGIRFTNQVTMLDTSMTTMVPWDVLATPDNYHDVSLLTLDRAGKTAYMLSDHVTSAPDPTFDNQLFSIPVPAMNPTTFYATNVDGFWELTSVNYVAPGNSNGFNGMASSQNFLYIYDGQWLQKWDALVCGCRVGQAITAAAPYVSGGVDVDKCENVYIGNLMTAKVYNSSMALTSTIPLVDTVYDIALGANYSTLYACGQGFVSSIYLPLSTTQFVKTKTPSSCSCTGTATAPLNICGSAAVGATYTWSNGQTGQTATGLCPGTYTITANVGGPCAIVPPYYDTITVFKSAGWPSIAKAVTSTNCSGNTGSATANVTGGVSPYTYSWDNGATTATISNLTTGKYCVTAKDAGGCPDTACITVTMQGNLSATLTSATLACFGDKNASASISAVTGGASPFTYSWNNGQTTSSATGLAAGSYTCIVNDKNGKCADTLKTTITQPAVLHLQASGTDPVCHGVCTGSANIIPSGGTSTYSYSWNNGSTITNPGALCAGTYSVTLTDKNNCKHDTSIVINEPPAIMLQQSAVPSLCGQPNGSATVTASGGTAPFTYSWNTGGTLSTLPNLHSGIYKITVQDAKACQDTVSVTVTGTSTFSDTPKSSNALCYGSSDGSATITSAGGTPPFKYTWNNGQTTSSATGLAAGSYTCIVNDNSGNCADTLKFIIAQPAPLQLKASGADVVCHGVCTGYASVLSSGGTTPYSYSWNNNATTDSIKGLCAGNYSVAIADKNGCPHDTTFTIIEPAAISFTSNVTPTTCNASNGTASITTAGGTSPYTFSWNNNSSPTPSLSNIASGNYFLTVTDSKGCKDTISVIVPNTSPFSMASAPAKVACYNDKTASLSTTVTGTSGPYTYSWSNGETTSSISNLGAGVYSLNVTDKDGCVGTLTDTVSQPSQLAVEPSAKVICEGESSTLVASASGGTNPYTYVWDNSVTASTYNVTPGVTTGYHLVATDANGCQVIENDTVKVIPVPQAAFSGIDVCVGLPTTFKDSSYTKNGTPVNTWIWNFGDGTSNASQNPTHTYTMQGTYTVSLSVSIGPCTTTITHVVTVYPLPHADFEPSPQPTTILNPVITFTDLSNGGVKGLWDLGDSTNIIYTPGINPVHRYPDENKVGGETYLIKLNIVNQYGCPDTISKLIHIDPDWTFFVPNTFTPNGDGKNDLFFGTGWGIQEKEMWIFDRWGNLIFHTNDLYGGWDGKVQGGASNEVAQEDTYVWLIMVKDIFLKDHRYIGHVNIIK